MKKTLVLSAALMAMSSLALAGQAPQLNGKLPRPPCITSEPNIQLFSNPPIGNAYLMVWRKDQPEEKVTLTKTTMVGECYLVTKWLVNRLSPADIKWDVGICVKLSSPDGMLYVEGCN